MSTVLKHIPVKDDLVDIFKVNDNIVNNNYKYVLKPKEKKLKSKCNKALKKKLKKYKLRRDGIEDQDVLDVSQTLQATLKIKSPNSQKEIIHSDIEILKPTNYLFKMAKKNKKAKKNDLGSTGITTEETIVTNIQEKEVISNNNSQDKKQTNAFKLLMDSRNKSIGSNSPGKEKTDDVTESQEIIEQRNIKVKRNLILQKMAEGKGLLKNKELEEYKDQCIQRKMDKRAERFKAMITKKDSIKLTKAKQSSISVLKKEENISLDASHKNDVCDEPTKRIQLINIFNDEIQTKNSDTQHISKDDEEFLKKLSPSIRKKENMLSYFAKINKANENKPIDEDCTPEPVSDTVIKVKLISKAKSKVKKKKTAKAPRIELNNENIIDVDDDILVTNKKNVGTENNRKKRKRKEELIQAKPLNDNENATLISEKTDSRPKRCTKKPVKYVEDFQLSSSDEELHIFTPKKKKRGELNNSLMSNKSDSKIPSQESKNILPTNGINHTQKKSTKLAPIFSAKTQPDSASIEAKQKFLQSGMPDQIKKIISKQKLQNEGINTFPTVVHIQQQNEVIMPALQFNKIIQPNYCDDDMIKDCGNEKFSELLNLKDEHNTFIPELNKNSKSVLHEIKLSFPKFPVYRTYHLLREKRKGQYTNCKLPDFDDSVEVINDMIDITNENPDRLNWTTKYKALSTNQIIGNFTSIKELRKWLISWTENVDKQKVNMGSDSDSSDFCYYSDTDSKESVKKSNNLLILSGPIGCGKTSCVYAVASELAMKVIEVNASSKRTGKIMLQDLQEATQSHKVNRGIGNSENSQKTQEIKTEPQITKKPGRPKKKDNVTKNAAIVKNDTLSQQSSQESGRTGMSLILIDDADIVFDQDDGFCAAIAQLAHSSKRPVILITTSLTCPHLQRFIQCGKIITLHSLLPRMLGTWLDLMCLADNKMCWPGLGAKFLEYYRGDIRKTINCLQFYITSHPQISSELEEVNSQNIDHMKQNIDDENSGMSWADRENFDDKIVTSKSYNFEDTIWKYFMEKQYLGVALPLKLFNLWWNIPKFLTEKLELKQKSCENQCNTMKLNSKSSVKLENVAKFLDTISIVDCYRQTKISYNNNYSLQPWSTYESDSMSESENIDNFDINHKINDDISNAMLLSSIIEAQEAFKCDIETDMHFSEMTIERERERIVSRHNSLTSCLNSSVVLDRKALALDYWSSCRTICRVEKNKTENNSRRNNRFCHYLKSLNILCKSDSYDKLADSLHVTEQLESG